MTTTITNEHKKLNVPNLRFPEFQGEWEEHLLGNISDVTKLAGFEFTKYVTYEDTGSIIAIRGLNCKNGSLDLRDVKYIDNSDFSKLSRSKLYVGDILYTYVGTVGEVAVVDKNDKYYLAPNVSRIRLSKDYNSDFIKQLLSSKKFYYKIVFPLIATSSQPALSMENLRRFKLRVPSIKEQKKIASLFNAIDERIATQNKIIEDLKKLKSAIIDYAINSLDTDFAKFGSLYEMAGEGGTPTTSNASFYDNGKIPFIKIDDLKQKYLTENKDFITELGLQKSSAWLVPTHSILFSNGATIGEIPITTYPVCTKQGILGIVPKQNIDVEFLYYFMSSSYFKKAVSRIVTEGTMKTAYLKDINNILCPIPTKEKQQEIAKMPSALNSKIDFEQSILKLFCSQKQHLLRQMFI